MYLYMKIFNTLETKSYAWLTDHNAAYMALVVYWQFSLSHINMTNFQKNTHSKYSFCHKPPSSWLYLREVVKIWTSITVVTVVRTSNHIRQVLWEWQIIYRKQRKSDISIPTDCQVKQLHSVNKIKGRVASSLGSCHFFLRNGCKQHSVSVNKLVVPTRWAPKLFHT
jgi:hypothetical protein